MGDGGELREIAWVPFLSDVCVVKSHPLLTHVGAVIGTNKIPNYKLVCVSRLSMINSTVTFATCLFVPCPQGLVPNRVGTQWLLVG